MTYDPLQDVDDEPLQITTEVLAALRSYRVADKAQLLPGVDPQEEQAQLNQSLNELADRLLAGIEGNPSKLWALGEFQRSLIAQGEADTEVREHFGLELEALMDILGIESSDGLLSWYLGGI
jgi:hypothetical protein